MDFVSFTDWGDLPESADALFADGERESVFLSRPWFENLADTTLDEDQSLSLACVIDGKTLRAILPIVCHASGNWHALSNHFTSRYSVLVSKVDRESVLECLARGLRQLPVDDLRLQPFVKDDETMVRLQGQMETSGFRCHRRFHFYNWILELDGRSFEQYMAGRPARLRNTIARKRRKLEREQGYDIRLFTDDDLQQAMADYHAVFDASWKAKEQFTGFIDGLMRRMLERGWLRLAVLSIQGRPAAVQFWIVAHRKASIFRLAYDEAWKQYSPGSILTAYLMEHVIDTDKVGEIDFLTGNDRYKQDWMSDRQERWAMGCANLPAPTGRGTRFLETLKGLFRAK